jgi:aspartyl-tRNA(Asn)/glutamyl-tRNA(Gln) amidotransferase subunit A
MTPAALSIVEASNAMQRGQLSAVELAESVLEQIDKLNPTVNAYITVRHSDDVLGEARQADQQRREGQAAPLTGIPIALKDNFATAGTRTTAGSKILAEWIPDRDATVVGKLKQAGAIIAGKLNMHEFANGTTNDNPHFGKTRNPWDPDRTPAGSSGGSGAALAAAMCLGATGSDTGGSIREPAAFCGVVGLKPTYGLVGRAGVVPFSWSLDHAGPMARTVADTALLLQVMAGYDPGDPGSVPSAAVDYLRDLGRGVDGIVVGIERHYFTKVMDPGVRRGFETTVEHLQALGARIQEIHLPAAELSLAAELAILFPEAASLHRSWLDERPQDYGEDVRRSLLSGRLYRAVDYVEAQRVRALLRKQLAEAFQTVQVLLTPTMIIEPVSWGCERFVIDGAERDPLEAFIRCLVAFNLTGNPALAVPCGYGDGGLPVGVQLVGPPFSEATLFRVGRAIETRFEPNRRTPPLLEASTY